jgi:hypothetical protein
LLLLLVLLLLLLLLLLLILVGMKSNVYGVRQFLCWRIMVVVSGSRK